MSDRPPRPQRPLVPRYIRSDGAEERAGWLASMFGLGFGNAFFKANWTTAAVWGYAVSSPITVGCASAGVFGVLGLWFYRCEAIESSKCKQDLHDLIHVLRDDAFQIIGGKKRRNPKPSQFRIFMTLAATKTATLFRQWANSNNIECVIRIARTRAENSSKSYLIIGASDVRANSLRQVEDEVSVEDAMVKALMSKDNRGIVTIGIDHPKNSNPIESQGASDLVKSVDERIILAPINGWTDGAKQMFGILEVIDTSKKLSLRHCVMVAILADFLGFVVPVLLLAVESEANSNQPNRNELKPTLGNSAGDKRISKGMNP